MIGGSYQPARAAETFSLENKRESGRYVYACVYKPRDVERRASYTLSIRTTALRPLPSQSAGKENQ